MSCVRQVLHRRCKWLCDTISNSWGCIHKQQPKHHHHYSTMTTTNDYPVLLTTENNIAIATLNRPKALHALNTEMVDMLYDAYMQWNSDPAVHAIVLRGAGDKAFCAGGDVKGVVALAKAGNVQEAVRFFQHEYTLDLAIHNLPKPHIALLDGITMGGGVGISVHGPIRVATERTLFAMPECGIGLFPDVGGSWFLPRLPLPGMGLYLALTGARLTGMAVKHAGIATHFIPHARMQEVMQGLQVLGDDVGSVAAVDACLQGLEEVDGGGGIPHADDIAEVFGDGPSLQQIHARLRARTDEWGTSTYAQLTKGSPLSQRVTWEQLRRGAGMTSLQACLEMEAVVAQRMVEGASDFAEGVRAALVDRSGDPAWRHGGVDEVGDQEVAWFFEGAGGGGGGGERGVRGRL